MLMLDSPRQGLLFSMEMVTAQPSIPATAHQPCPSGLIQTLTKYHKSCFFVWRRLWIRCLHWTEESGFPACSALSLCNTLERLLVSGFVAERLLGIRLGRIKPSGGIVSHGEETTSSSASPRSTCGRETWKPDCCFLTEEQAGRRTSILELQFMVYYSPQSHCSLNHQVLKHPYELQDSSERVTSQIGCTFYRQLLCGTLTVDHLT